VKQSIQLSIFIILTYLTIPVNGIFSQTQFWQQTNGPYGGYIYDIAKDSVGNLYVATNGGGVFYSSDQGNTWSQLTNGMKDRTILSLTFDKSGALYAGTWQGTIYRLNAISSSWIELFSAPSPIYEIATNDNGLLVAGGGAEICINYCPAHMYYSTDVGEEWTEIALPRRYMNDFTLNSNNLLIVLTDSGMYRSSDLGEEWQRIDMYYCCYYDGDIIVDENDYIYMANPQGLFKSTDDGNHWTLFGPASYAIAINDNEHIYTAGPSGLIFRTTDGGNTWLKIDSLGHYSHSILSYSDSTIFVDDHSNGGLFRSIDLGNTWKLVGVQSTDVNSLCVVWQGNIYAGADWGLYKTTDHGNEWSRISDIQLEIIYSSPDGLLVVLAWNTLFKSGNGGVTWRHVLPPGVNQISTVYLRRNGQWMISFMDTSGIYSSSDMGHTWQWLGLHKRVLSIETYGDSDIFAGTMNHGVYHSSDNGLNWYQTDNILCSLSVNKLAVHPSGALIAATDNSFYRSTDLADSWSLIDTAQINDIVLNNEGKMFAGTQYGVIYSADTGVTWMKINDGLTTLTTNCLAVDSNGYLYAGTSGSGVFRSTQTTTNVKPFLDHIPSNFILEQNYPNPFNPSTQINFSIPKATNVTLKVYDVLGQEVAVLVNERKQAGEYNVTWNAADVPSGVYFYRIVAGEFVETKKMVLIR